MTEEPLLRWKRFKCSRCGACKEQSAETKCKPHQDQSGEYDCPSNYVQTDAAGFFGYNELVPPLFIPLKAEYYDAFERGDKTEEWRKYGDRWNERVCQVGRPVILSRGYGKTHRLKGTITNFIVTHASEMRGLQKIALSHVYGALDFDVARIEIKLDKKGGE